MTHITGLNFLSLWKRNFNNGQTRTNIINMQTFCVWENNRFRRNR